MGYFKSNLSENTTSYAQNYNLQLNELSYDEKKVIDKISVEADKCILVIHVYTEDNNITRVNISTSAQYM